MKREYKPYPERETQIKDAKKIIGAILTLDISDAMRVKVIRQMIWNITGVDYKYKIRYQSQEVLDNPEAPIIHEHVSPIKDLIEDILKNRDNFEKILDEKAVACIVTKKEHDKLSKIAKENPNLKGWDRYTAANIIYVDLKEKI